ncbi:MAG: hypothetical protein ACW98F_03645 [Candidatus Hodarchaeales archaeon]|jgi:RPA family protein
MKRRAPYKRIKIQTVNSAEVTKDNEERWRLINADGSTIFRIWIVGVVTEKFEGENNYLGLKIEDGSGAILTKSWDGKMDSFSQWDKVEILGQIQISEQDETVDVFVTPDIIENIEDDNWFIYHKLKVIQQSHHDDSEFAVKSAVVEGIDLGVASLEDLKTKLKKLVKQLDQGSGVTMDDIISKMSNIDEAQIYDAITELLESGEFFEPQVGIYSIAFE